MTSLDPREDVDAVWHVAAQVSENYAARCRLTLVHVFPGERVWIFITSPGTWVECYTPEAYEYLYARACSVVSLLPRPDMPVGIVAEFTLNSWEVKEQSALRLYFPEDESIIHALKSDIERRKTREGGET